MVGDFGNLDFLDDMLAEWREHASCRGLSDLFFPGLGETTEQFDLRVERCKVVCRACPVRSECRSWALSSRDEGVDLVLGGMSYKERLVKMNRKNRLGRAL
jgi:WhiB family redox-sensing transcriptional regulator